jgi:hypothetical protein
MWTSTLTSPRAALRSLLEKRKEGRVRAFAENAFIAVAWPRAHTQCDGCRDLRRGYCWLAAIGAATSAGDENSD